MRIRIVKQYCCDFCKKKGLSAGHMKKHILRCTCNPNRECRMCKHPVKPLSLIGLLPDPKQFLKIEKDYNNNECYEGWKDTYKEPLENIKKECNYCPACTLAVLRQSKVPLYMLYFDYKKEVEEWWKEKNKIEWEEEVAIGKDSFRY